MNVNGKEARKRGVSILLTLIMVLTTMMPAWAYGNEAADASAVKQSSQEAAEEAQEVLDEQQSGDEEKNDTIAADESGSSTQTEESGSDVSESTDAETVQYFAVISSDRAGTEKKDNAPYIEAGIVKLQESSAVSVKKDQLEKQSDGVYRGTQDLNDGSSAGYSDGNSYEVALKNYYGDDGTARDGYHLEGIDINGYMIKMSEIEADRDHHIQIARGSISGYDGDADAYVNSKSGKDIGLSFAGSGAFSSDLRVTFVFADDVEKADSTITQQDAVKAAKAAAKAGTEGSKAASSHENQVRVIVENTTYPKSEGALWDGTLVDTWIDLNEDSTMMSCVVAALNTVGAKQTGAENNYISEINGLGEFDGGSMSGWMGTLNDWFTNEGFGAFTVAAGKLSAGDEIRIMYTCAYGGDIGGSWGNNDKRVIAVEASAGTITPAFDKDTHEYTIDLPEGTEAITIRPTAANKNFQVRTFAGGKEYKRNDAIPVSSGTVILVKCGDPSWSSMNGNSDPAQEYTLTVKIKEPVTVKADVTASFQQANTYLLTPQILSVDSDLAERYGYTDTVDPEKSVSALDVLVRLHEVMLEDAFDSETKDSILVVNDGTISTIMGEKTTAVSFAVNGAFPYDPDGEYNSSYGYTGYMINQAPVADGDSMDVFFYQDSYYMDYYTWFEQDGSKVSSLSVKQGESISLDLQGVMYAYCGSLKKEDAIKQGGLGPVEDAQLTVVDAATGASEDISGAITDEDGHAEISFKKAGTYYVSAYGTSEYTPITSPWLKISVTSSAPVLKEGVSESTAASVKKGQAYTLDLDSIFEDPQNDKLTYTVSVDGAEAVAAESSYSVTFDSAGAHKLVFRASDGLVSSEDTYTVKLTVEKPEQARLESLIIHTGNSPTDTSVLVKNKNDKYTSGQVFDPETSEYVLAAQTDSVSQLRFRAEASDSSAKVMLYYGDGQSKDITWKSGSSKFANCLSPGKNTITIKVEPAAGSDKEGAEYTFAVDCVPTLTGITAKSSGTELYLDKQFSSSVSGYTLTIPETTEIVDLTAVPKNQGYTVLYNGKESPSVDVKGREKIEITVSAESGDSRLENIYTLDLKRAAQLDFKLDATPDDAIVKVYDSEGAEVKANKDGSFSGMFAECDYTYLITKYGYVAQSGKVPAVGGALKITLQKAADDGLKDVSSDWNNFRGSDSNMGITDVMTPVSKDDTTLLWNAKLGSGWAAAPSVQIIADDALIVMTGTTICKLDLKTGETLKTGTMAGSPSYGYTPPVYAEGMIFCPLGSGTIQAFNAETLESLWIYRDPLKGQALSPITYSNGYIYTGFWNSEEKDANYVCISVTDEDVTRTDEEKQATWKHRQSGGYYWAGSVAVGNCVIVGNDDGGSGTSGDSTLTSYDSLTGEVISELQLKGAGDQRSSIAYDRESGRVYFTTKGGYLCSAVVDAKTGKLSSLKMVNYNAQSTSTPVVYKGTVYFAAGSGISSSGSSGNFVAADAGTLEMKYVVGLKGYPQCSMLLSTAYEDEGYLCFYSTYNMQPGGISLIKVKNDAKSAGDTELIELYDAKGFEQYCISSIICDKNGTLYYKNDSGNVFAVGLPDYKTVRNLIDKIGEVTLDSRTAIDTARKAYDALSDENKEKVTNYDKLVAAEKKLAQLEAEKKREDEKKNENSGSKGGASGTAAAAGSTKSAGSVTKTADVKISGGLTEAAKAAIEKIKSVNDSDLPEKAEQFTKDQLSSIEDAYRAYNELSESEKKAVEADGSWEAFSKTTAKLGGMYHYDKDSGIDVRDNKEKALPWYIKLSITAAELSSSQEKAVKDVIGEDSEIFTMNDISFVNTLDGSEWHPEDLIKVKMPSADIGSYKSAIIVHISDDGKVQLIEGNEDEADSTVSFESSDFSLYGIAGSMESVDSLLGAQAGADVLPWIILAGVAAAALAAVITARRRSKKQA